MICKLCVQAQMEIAGCESSSGACSVRNLKCVHMMMDEALDLAMTMMVA